MSNLNKGLILTCPYGQLVNSGEKTLIIKSRKFTKISNKIMLLIENKVGLGFILLNNPEPINLVQFKKLFDQHKIPESDRKAWWSNYKQLFAYQIVSYKKLTKPILLDYKTGPQVTVNLSNIQIKKVYVGTSGFDNIKPAKYDLNSVEINTTFYQFPNKTLVSNLSKLKMIYSIKVSQIITHYKQLKNVSKLWKTFYLDCEPIQDKIKCFLFQFSDRFEPNDKTINKIKKFAKILDFDSGFNYVFEFRNDKWFDKKYIELIHNLGLVFCSIFSHKTKLFVHNNGIFYLRLHGYSKSDQMYVGKYNLEQLSQIYDYIKDNKISESYIYFNNTDDSSAQPNSHSMYKKFNQLNLVQDTIQNILF